MHTSVACRVEGHTTGSETLVRAKPAPAPDDVDWARPRRVNIEKHRVAAIDKAPWRAVGWK